MHGEQRKAPPTRTCADEAGEASIDDFVIVGQYERTPGLHLQTILLARNCLSAVKLCDFKVLGAEPGFVDNLKRARREESETWRECHTHASCKGKAGLGEHALVSLRSGDNSEGAGFTQWQLDMGRTRL